MHRIARIVREVMLSPQREKVKFHRRGAEDAERE
ncbi:hypothetical protein SBDP2_940005 [Syntrophobacter sp. SbD2]|nr:hypothetical protein SBDP2_940005 [Syntrophobacter sp. SbD2]